MFTISNVPKYSVVPGSILEFLEAKLTELDDSVILSTWIAESTVQSTCASHKETDFVNSNSSIFSSKSSVFSTINHQLKSCVHILSVTQV